MGLMILLAPLFAYFGMREMSRTVRLQSVAGGSPTEWFIDSPPVLLLCELGALACLRFGESGSGGALLPVACSGAAVGLLYVTARASLSRRYHIYSTASALVLVLAITNQSEAAIVSGILANVLLQGYEMSIWGWVPSDGLPQERSAEEIRSATRRVCAAMDSVALLSMAALARLPVALGTPAHPNVPMAMGHLAMSLLAVLFALDAPLGPFYVGPLTWPALARQQARLARWACRGVLDG